MFNLVLIVVLAILLLKVSVYLFMGSGARKSNAAQARSNLMPVCGDLSRYATPAAALPGNLRYVPR